MKMKRLLSKILVCFILLITTVPIVQASPTNLSLSDLRRDYVEKYINFVEGTTITAIAEANLLDVANSQVIAVCYSLSSGGYAIIDIQTNLIYEYSLEADSPYSRQTEPYYYAGPNNYFVKENSSLFVHTIDNTLKANTTSVVVATTGFSDYRASINSVRSLEDKIADLVAAEANPTRAIAQGNLTSALSTDYLNGFCGPTSMYNLLKYQGKIRNPPSPTPIDEIVIIATYTGITVSLSSLVNGTINYLQNYNVVGTVFYCNYSWAMIVNRIGMNRPITLGTNGGGLATGGHVQTVHGYYSNDIPTSLVYIRIIYVNNGWGSNNIAITYDNAYGVPSYLKDHVYVN